MEHPHVASDPNAIFNATGLRMKDVPTIRDETLEALA